MFREQWIVRVGEKEHRATDLPMVTNWLAEGRIPKDAWVYHRTLGEWKRAGDLPTEMPTVAAAGAASPSSAGLYLRSRVPLLLLVPVLLVGSCTGFVGGFAFSSLISGTSQDITFASREELMQEVRKRDERQARQEAMRDTEQLTNEYRERSERQKRQVEAAQSVFDANQ